MRKVDEIPYDFSRKRLTVVVEEEAAGRHRLVTKGAFDSVMAVCAMADEARAACVRYYQQASAQGLRVLAVATREVAPRGRYGREDEQDLRLAGFLLFLDPPKEGVADTLRQLARLGIRTKVISGDNRHIVAHVAREIGIDARAILTGEQLGRMADEALWSLAPRTNLFVEVNPQQKERIVRALQRTGHTVAYLGDGINDAPAL
ncbi:MAG: HAD family hydrolase [Ramlibacter sp.]